MIEFNSILYMYSNMDSSSQILLFLIILVTLMLVSILVINQITKKKNEKMFSSDLTSKKISTIKQKINKSNDDLKPSVSIKDASKNKANIETKEIPKVVEEKVETFNQKENAEEIKQEEVIKISKKTSLEDITRMIENNLEQEPINLTKFEEDQEENAIISYDELVKRAGAKKIVYKCEDENDVLDKVEKKEESKKEITTKSDAKKFQASKVISPIFGIQKQKEEPDEVLESFIDLEEFKYSESTKEENESKSDIDFLTSLKEFRSGLE